MMCRGVLFSTEQYIAGGIFYAKRRKKLAAAKLVEEGYTNIIDCGGILDWTGEIEK